MPLATFDWITCAVETVGIVIFCIWVVVPVREFRAILARLLKPQKVLPLSIDGEEKRPTSREITSEQLP